MKTLFLVIFATLFFSCGKEEFIVPATQESSSLQLLEKKVITGGYDLQPIKPKVDFLFIWDNSGSQRYVSQATKQALAQTLTNISTDFDFRIVLAPLLPPLQNQQTRHLSTHSSIFAPKNEDIPYKSGSTNGKINPYFLWKPIAQAGTTIESMPYITSGTQELGIERAVQLVDTARIDQIFRQQAYTIIVLISNGDDSGSYIGGNEMFYDPNYLDGQVSKLSSIASGLNSKMVRFFSLVPFTTACKIGARPGYNYRAFSSKVYQSIGVSEGVTKVSGGINDSWDFCSSNHFQTLFQGINHTIRQEMPYTYLRWPVHTFPLSSKGVNGIDFSFPFNVEQTSPGNYKNFRVYKVDGNNPQYKTIIPPSASYGWNWSGSFNQIGSPELEEIDEIWKCKPTHESSLGECSSLDKNLYGYFIKFNNYDIKYPDHVRIETSDPPDYYGFIKISFFPYISEQYPLRIYKNGVEIPSSQFELLEGIKTNFNLKIKSRTDFSEDSKRPDRQTGYIIKLKSSAVYTNGDTIQVRYNPTAVAPGS